MTTIQNTPSIRETMERGYAALMVGELQEAAQAFGAARKALPDSPVPGVLQSTLQLAQRDVTGALRTLRHLVRQFPANALARVHLAEAYMLVGQPSVARKHLKVSEALDGADEVREFAGALHAWMSATAANADNENGD